MKTLDEAINYYEDMAYQKDLESGFDTDNMTDREAISILQENIDSWLTCPCPEHDIKGDVVEVKIDIDDITAFNMGIEAIKQKSRLDKINNILDEMRAEIVNLGQCTMNDNRASGIWACRDIIDKYKESVEKIWRK